MGPAAITFAARHPERISCLMLWCTYANFADHTAAPQVTALRSLLYKDWNLYTEAGAHAFVGWERGEAAHKLAELMRQSTTQPAVDHETGWLTADFGADWLQQHKDEGVNGAIRSLVDAGVPILALEREGGRLSDAFLALTEEAD